MRLTTFLLIILIAPVGLAAQYAPVDDLNKMATNCTANNNDDLPALVECLTKGLTNDEEKVRAMTYWITANIAYDVARLRGGKTVAKEDILRSKRGVCSDYSKLFRSMCTVAGIECYLVEGYSKGIGYQPGQIPAKPDHAWNVVFIEDSPHLLDLTWASGAVEATNGNFKYRPHYEEKMILADPATFAEQHLPADPRWQLTDTPVTLDRFLAHDDYAAMTAGITPSQAYADSLTAYRRLDEYARKAATWKSAHYFHPSREVLRIRVEELLNSATYLSRGKRIDKNLVRAAKYCQAAYHLAAARTDWPRRKFYMETATQGIKYVRYRMGLPPAQ
jgi:hypothetical protein